MSRLVLTHISDELDLDFALEQARTSSRDRWNWPSRAPSTRYSSAATLFSDGPAAQPRGEHRAHAARHGRVARRGLGDRRAAEPGRSDFHPRVDVYYSEGPIGPGEGDPIPKAVVTADLAGVGADAVNVEISGRMLVISGTRPVRRREGRAYQQVEIPTGTFRRAIELGVDIDSNRARASFRGRTPQGRAAHRAAGGHGAPRADRSALRLSPGEEAA